MIARRLLLLAVCLAALASGAALAVQPDEQLANPSLEHRAREISGGLRCLVCQNQSIDDSNAGLARDLRILVRRRLQAGDTDEQVRDFLVARYGDFVLLKPPFEISTLLLWLTPILVLTAGGLVTLSRVRASAGAVAGLSGDEEAQLARIVAAAPAGTFTAGGITKD